MSSKDDLFLKLKNISHRPLKLYGIEHGKPSSDFPQSPYTVCSVSNRDCVSDNETWHWQSSESSSVTH